MLRVFVSSTMTDLIPERSAIRQAIKDLELDPIMAEDLGSRDGTPRQITLSLVEESDLYVGLFWQRYGDLGPIISRQRSKSTKWRAKKANPF